MWGQREDRYLYVTWTSGINVCIRRDTGACHVLCRHQGGKVNTSAAPFIFKGLPRKSLALCMAYINRGDRRVFTVTVSHSAVTVTVSHSTFTVTVSHSAFTVTVSHSAATVTLPHSAATVTLSHSAATMTLSHSAATMTVPKIPKNTH